MDFSRLVAGQDANLTRQFAEKLLSNAAFRDAAIKAAEEADSNNDSSAQQDDTAVSGLDNLLNQLTTALQNATTAGKEATAAAGTDSDAVTNLLTNPALQQALNGLDLESALGIKVLLGQVSADVAQQATNLLSQLPSATIGKVNTVLRGLDSATLEKGVHFFQALFGTRDDRVFAQQNNSDVYLNSSNSRVVNGADLNKFLQTAYYVVAAGYDIGKYLDHATKALTQGDYDDFRRFLDVTDMMLYKGENLDTFFNFGDKVLDEAANDYEGNMFQAYMTVLYGGHIQDYVDIAGSLDTDDAEGRNNMVDLTRIIVDMYKHTGNAAPLLQTLAAGAREGGSVRAMMDEYMELRGLEDTSPDYSLFDRIERIDTGVMRIKQGESAAVFAQAISSRDGLLSENVLYWSSLETGAISHGSSYLDLSKLGPGTYHIYCKIGNYAGGTDTATKTVIIEPGEGQQDEQTNKSIVLPEAGQIKITLEQGSAQLRSDLFMKFNAEIEKLVENAQRGGEYTSTRTFSAGDKLDFFIRTSHPDGAYDHGTDIGTYYCKVTQTSPTTWSVSFEDLQGEESDEDFDDVKFKLELIKIAQELESGGEPVDDDTAGVVSPGHTPASDTGNDNAQSQETVDETAAEAARLATEAAAARKAAEDAIQAAEEEAARLAAKWAAEDAAARAAVEAAAQAAAEQEARLAADRAAADAAAQAAAEAAAEEEARLAAERAAAEAAALAEAEAAARAAAEEAARIAAEEAARIAAERAAADAAALSAANGAAGSAVDAAGQAAAAQAAKTAATASRDLDDGYAAAKAAAEAAKAAAAAAAKAQEYARAAAEVAAQINDDYARAAADAAARSAADAAASATAAQASADAAALAAKPYTKTEAVTAIQQALKNIDTKPMADIMAPLNSHLYAALDVYLGDQDFGGMIDNTGGTRSKLKTVLFQLLTNLNASTNANNPYT